MNRIISIAALGAALLAAPALGQQPTAQTETRVVDYSDLNLRTDNGMAKLDRRIRAAVEDACGPASDFDVRGKNEVRRCRVETGRQVAAQRSQAVASAWRSTDTALAAQ